MTLKKSLLALICAAFAINMQAQQPVAFNPYDENEAESCTSIMVGKKASTDGSDRKSVV